MQIRKVKHWIENISRILQQCFPNLATEMYITIQEKKIDSFCFVAMSTLLAPVLWCENSNIQVCSPLGWAEGLARNTHGSHLALTLSIRLLRVNDRCVRQLMRIRILRKTKIIVVKATARQMPDGSKAHSPKGKLLTFIVSLETYHLLIFTLVCLWLALLSGWGNSNINIKKVTFYN